MAAQESSKEYRLYAMSFGLALDHIPDHPERTAYRLVVPTCGGSFVMFRVYPTRLDMLATLAMYEEVDWRPWSEIAR